MRNQQTGTLDNYGAELAAVLQAMGHPHRIKILTELSQGPSQFNALLEKTGLRKTALSHHLTTLAKEELITQAARGTYVITPDGAGLLDAVADTYAVSRMKKNRESERRADLILRAYRGDTKVNKPDTRIVKLAAMRVVPFTAVSESPEPEAFKMLNAWARQKGYESLEDHPVFGFERPDLYEGKKRAYTFWQSIPKSYKKEEGVNVIEVPSATYAVTTCATKGDPFNTIPQAWERLLTWVKENGYEFRQDTPCLEKHVAGADDDFVLELHLPLKA